MSLSDQLKSLKRKPGTTQPEQKPSKGHGRQVLELFKQRPIAVTLVIQRQTCAHCGAVEEISNRHLLATHAPPNEKVMIVHVGAIPSGIPLRTQIEEAPAKSDFCKQCWPGFVAGQKEKAG